jgi:DMSO/TMAO reductase YedYZ molybdopterin-dependent catalytic subunit
MRTTHGAWASAGVLTGLAGLAVSHAVAAALNIRESPVVAATEGIIRATPGSLVEPAIQLLGTWNKPVLLTLVVLGLLAAFVAAGLLAKRSVWLPVVIFVALAGAALASLLTAGTTASTGSLPIAAGFLTWVLALSTLTEPLRRTAALEELPEDAAVRSEPVGALEEARGQNRRGFLVRVGAVAVATLAASGLGSFLSRDRSRVQAAREMLKLPVTAPDQPAGAKVGVEGVAPWRTPNEDFYLIHTAIAVPIITPEEYSLRIHGQVERELKLTYAELADREFTEAWITLNCVSNEVGGDLIGNAWWSGVKISELLAEAGVRPGANAVLQTSADGWTCGTPLAALTDGRNAMLALGMNGEPLPVDHGFPARMVVPGLYGFVSATKWVVDLEVTNFDEFEAYWTSRGWAEQAPVKMASRIDVPSSGGQVEAGRVRFGGSAWAQHTGIAAVHVSVDGGPWTPAELGEVPHEDTWVQWAATVEVEAGEHRVFVRATDRNGQVQTSVERDVIPDGATGWHSIPFSAA